LGPARGVHFMFRDVALISAAVAALGLVSSVRGASAAETKVHRIHPARVTAIHAEGAYRVAVRRPAFRATRKVSAVSAPVAPGVASYQLPAPTIDSSAGAPISLAYQFSRSSVDTTVNDGSVTPPVLTEQESAANQMATARGDRDFLMVDKALGKIILFQKGQPVFVGPALTGQSLSDQLVAGELGQKFDNLYAVNTKITPAGRFTVQRAYDKELGGDILDVSEIRGKDWGIAIHQVYLGTPSEHRDIRIKSPRTEDKHISFGCINVTQTAIRYLLRELPETGPFPLYILPEDASQTASYFAPGTS
jgi:hypothetical protein